jgi:hypothetical protein
MGYTEQRRLVHMRTLSITSFLIQACIVSVAIWPNHIGAEDSGPAAFRIEISQPQYSSRAGQAWTCLTAALVQYECWQSVPLIIFGRPTLAQIQVRIVVSPLKRKAVEVYASLDHPQARYQPRGWYRASGGWQDRDHPLVLNTDGSLAKEIRLEYWGEKSGLVMNALRLRSHSHLRLPRSPRGEAEARRQWAARASGLGAYVRNGSMLSKKA